MDGHGDDGTHEFFTGPFSNFTNAGGFHSFNDPSAAYAGASSLAMHPMDMGLDLNSQVDAWAQSPAYVGHPAVPAAEAFNDRVQARGALPPLRIGTGNPSAARNLGFRPPRTGSSGVPMSGRTVSVPTSGLGRGSVSAAANGGQGDRGSVPTMSAT